MLKTIEEFEDYDELDPIDGVLCAVLVDGREAYKTYNHPLWVLFQNGFEEDAPFVPLTVGDIPHLYYNVTLRIPKATFNNLCRYVSANRKLLKDLADRVETTASYRTYARLYEAYDNSNSLLYEMSNLLGSETGLQGTIWLDSGERWKKGRYYKRVKFDIHGDRSKSVSIGTTDEVKLHNDVPEKYQQEVRNARNWVGYNLFAINKVLDGEMSVKEFTEHMTRMEGKRPISYQDAQKYIPYRGINGTDYILITDTDNGRLNIANKDNPQKPLFSDWMGVISHQKIIRGELHILGNDDDYLYDYNLNTKRCIKKPWID